MAQTVRIMNWNIQNFGVTKCGVKFGNMDVVRAIAKCIVDGGVDIFVMLELNTTKHAVARAVAQRMLKELNGYAQDSRNADEFKTCVLSPNTGLEFYAFFIRNTATTIPLPITNATGYPSPPAVLGSLSAGLTDATFTAKTGAGVIQEFFPLIAPDVPDVPETTKFTKRRRKVPDWPATRLPVLGLFWVPGAAAANRLLPIVACHFAPDARAEQQFEKLNNFSLLAELGPAGTAPVALTVKPGVAAAAAHATNCYVLLGDFNVDFINNAAAYAPITGGSPQLNATGWINANTHLVTYQDYSPRTYKTADSLAINDFDNFFVRMTGGAGVAANPSYYPIPRWVSQRSVTLSASVKHYTELDKRGFTSDAYQDMVVDFSKQLTGDKSHIINVPGALVGSRLISDHLPVELDVTLN